MHAMGAIPPVTCPVPVMRRSYVRVIVVWLLQILWLFALLVLFS
jgi:hypothetical protein